MSKKTIIGLVVVAFLIGAGIFYMENYGGSFKGSVITDKTPSLNLLLMDGTQSMYENKNITPGASKTTVLRFGFASKNADATVQSFVLKAKGASLKSLGDISNIGLYREKDGALVASVPQFSSCNNNECSYEFSGLNMGFKASQPGTIFSVKIDVPVSALIGDDFQMRMFSSDIKAVSTVGEIEKRGNVAGSRFKIASNSSSSAELSISAVPIIDPSFVHGLTTIGTFGKTYFSFKLTAKNEPIKLTSLKLTAAGSSLNFRDIKNISIYQGENAIMTAAEFDNCVDNVCSYTWNSTDNLLPFPVDPVKPVILNIKADIGSTGMANLGDNFSFKISDVGTDVSAKGAYTNSAIPAGGKSGSASSENFWIVPFTITASADMPLPAVPDFEDNFITQDLGIGSFIGRFKITNNGNSTVNLTNISFQDNGTHTGSSTKYNVYLSDENAANYVGNMVGKTDDSSGFDFTLPTIPPVALAGGSYRYLSVQISSLGEAKSGDTFNLSIPSINSILYSVTESSLGYTGNPSYDADLEDTVYTLPVTGKPVLGIIKKK